jgi:hypothetical protein
MAAVLVQYADPWGEIAFTCVPGGKSLESAFGQDARCGNEMLTESHLRIYVLYVLFSGKVCQSSDNVPGSCR